jgi:hypothetical protein
MSDISGITSGLGSLSQSLSVGATNSLASVNSAQQLGGLFSNLNLTSAQQSQIQQILQNAKTQGLSPTQVANEINNVLTPTQQSQLQADLAKLKGHHHHHHGGGGSNSGSSNNTDAFGIPVPSSSTSNSGTIGNLAAAFLTQSQIQNNNTD